jgi:hypothetical protein
LVALRQRNAPLEMVALLERNAPLAAAPGRRYWSRFQ